MNNWRFYHFILKCVLAIICLLATIGAGIYRIYALNIVGIIITLVCVTTILCILYLFAKKHNLIPKFEKNGDPKRIKIEFKNLFVSILYIVSVAVCFLILYQNQTTEAIISPWQVVPTYFFIVFGISTCLLILNIYFNKNFSLLLVIVHYFLFFSVALLIYKLGYGFDSFIHQATENLISQNGVVNPKPFYYLGQYALVINLNFLTHLSVIFIDKFLVPLLAAIYLPIVFYDSLNKWFKDNVKSQLTVVFLLLLPLSFFIVTTPQNLAFLFFILLLLYGLHCDNYFDLFLIYLLALASLAAHPLTGIPAIIFALILTVYYSDNQKIKKKLYGILFASAAIALPLIFFLLEKISFSGAVTSQLKNTTLFPKFNLHLPSQENVILNLIYLYGFNISIIIFSIILFGSIIALKYKKECRIFSIYFTTFLMLTFSFLITKLLPFDFLIYYERSNYTDRILLTALFFLAPFIMVALFALVNSLTKQNNIFKYSFGLFLVIIISISLYITYPRFDNYHNTRGYSTSQNDLDAVKWIEKNADRDYIVLANQQVSAAAIKEFGFKKYYQSQIFYYPIPTGGPLYQYYLDMVYKKPTKITMVDAMELVDVEQAFFVLNKYWWAFPKILTEAKIEADSWKDINNGEIYIFQYSRAKD